MSCKQKKPTNKTQTAVSLKTYPTPQSHSVGLRSSYAGYHKLFYNKKWGSNLHYSLRFIFHSLQDLCFKLCLVLLVLVKQGKPKNIQKVILLTDNLFPERWFHIFQQDNKPQKGEHYYESKQTVVIGVVSLYLLARHSLTASGRAATTAVPLGPP